MSEEAKKDEQGAEPEADVELTLPSATHGEAGPGTSKSKAQGKHPNRRFRNRTDVLIAIERIIQLGLLGQLSPAEVRTYTSALRSMAQVMPKESIDAEATSLPDDLRARIASDPSLAHLLSGLLTPEQLEDLLRAPPAAGAGQ